MHTRQSQVSPIRLSLVCQWHNVVHCMATGAIILMHVAIFALTGGTLKHLRAQGCGDEDSSHDQSRNGMMLTKVRL